MVEDILEYVFSLFFGDRIKDARDEIEKKKNKSARIALTAFLFFIIGAILLKQQYHEQ